MDEHEHACLECDAKFSCGCREQEKLRMCNACDFQSYIEDMP